MSASEGNRAPRGNDAAAGRIAGRTRELVRRVPRALLVVLTLGVLLRIGLELSYRPAVFTFADAAPYINMANVAMFSDPARTAGYSVFLEIAHSVSSNVEVTITLQHLLGVAAAVILYGAVRRVGAPVWVALIGTAAILLSLDQIYLEHTIASESTFTFVFVAALYAAVRSLEPGRPLRGALTTRELWLLAAGLLLGASAWVRAVAAPLIPFFALWVVLAIPGRWYARAGRAALAALPAVALLLVYFALNQSATGTFGLTQSNGWAIYTRTAQFADCTQFTPPEGTEVLCETRPSDERPGPDFYSWAPESPAQRAFGGPPSANAKLGEFGWAVVNAQPIDYLRTVGNDFLRYFFPTLNAGRPYGDIGYELLAITLRDPPIEEDVRVNWVGSYFDTPDPVEVTGFAGALEDLQQVVRVHPLLLFQAAVLAVLGVFWARGRRRAVIVLLAGSTLLMLGVAAASTYNARYAIPINGPLVAAGALGLWVLLERLRSRPGRRGAAVGADRESR